jgi:hypothetical protein
MGDLILLVGLPLVIGIVAFQWGTILDRHRCERHWLRMERDAVKGRLPAWPKEPALLRGWWGL